MKKITNSLPSSYTFSGLGENRQKPIGVSYVRRSWSPKDLKSSTGTEDAGQGWSERGSLEQSPEASADVETERRNVSQRGQQVQRRTCHCWVRPSGWRSRSKDQGRRAPD